MCIIESSLWISVGHRYINFTGNQGTWETVLHNLLRCWKQWKQCQTLFFWAPKSLQMVNAAMKLKDAIPWKESYDQHRQHIKKQRHYFANKGPSSQGYNFSSSHVWMWELDYKENWELKVWCFWTVVLEKTLESPLDWLQGDPTSPS